jgi:signal transduction histidine kinase
LAHSLRAANEQLRRTNVDLDNFIYTASHDLKAPIANIEGLLLLLREQLPPEARQAGLVPRVLGMMQGAVERFQLTIAQLTDLAKLQQAHTQPAEEVNLPALVEAVRLDLAEPLAEARAELHINLDSCRTISFAPQHLRSIIYNLLTNAIKYRHPSRPLVVGLRCHALPDATVLEVQDNGLGLTAEQQGKLFGMFRRLHNHVPGSGMGLYMVKRIVENAGGTITVQSQPDQGSTFSVSLPH